MTGKPESDGKPEKGDTSPPDDLSHLAKDIISNVGVGIYIVQRGHFVYVSQLYQKLIGYPEEELIGRNSLTNIYPEDRELVRQQAIKRLKRELFDPYEYRYVRKNNEIIWVLETITPIKYKGERATLGSFMDITIYKLMERALRQSEEKYRTILESIHEGYFEVSLDGNLTFINDSMCRIAGCSREELLGSNHQRFTDKITAKKVFRAFNKVYRTGNPIESFDWQVIGKNGEERQVEASISLRNDSGGKPVGFKGILRDITERKRMEQKLNHMATHDALTGLPNRLMFSEILNHAIIRAKHHQLQLAVFFIDLDRFKSINDSLGHDAGDQLLKKMATRFKQSLRTRDIIARLGGDEFIILTEDIEDLNQVEALAQKIHSTVIQPIVLMDEECRVTTSIGISLYPRDGEDEQTLMKNADMAMYLAKEEGRNNYQFYAENIQIQAYERFSIETNLRRALERNELYLTYQAKLDFKTDQVTGVEALLRWESPYLGAVSPAQFIPVAEEIGLIVPIGRWVLKTACAQNVAWQRQGLSPVRMGVNLSLRQLMDDNLIEDISAALEESGMAPNLLELEITESMALHNPARQLALMTKLKEMGLRIAIDDFGTGYSALAQLKHFPIDTLKVDRSFIRNLPHDPENKAITEAIIAMGKTLSLTVVAEGVETLEQDDFLREKVCDEMQGFYFSKPVSPEKLAELLRKHIPFSRDK
jgi:diguanylate cyclase (GGDEF)-like protein/PAS domain S-box-containing protein